MVYPVKRQLRLTATNEDYRVAKLAALAIGIHVLEAALPSPLPGIKPGLANIVTLIVFALYGIRFASWVSLLRVFVGSLIIGTFLSPTFVLSLSGAVASVLVLWVYSQWRLKSLSVFGLAILMSIAHMSAQLIMVYWLFIPHEALFVLSPVFMTAALVFGVFNGFIAVKVTSRLNQHAYPTSS